MVDWWNGMPTAIFPWSSGSRQLYRYMLAQGTEFSLQGGIRPVNNMLRIGMAMVAFMAIFEASLQAQEAPEGAITLRIVTDQPEAALDILDKRARGEAIAEADWRRLRETEGYRRLKKRSESFGATEFDAKFESFLGEAPEVLASREALRGTVEDWSRLALDGVGRLALAYLPAGAVLRGSIYPVIKKPTNSFVFELDTDPAIFLYVDPEIGAAKFANTLTHELHHIGSNSACKEPEGYEQLDPDVRNAVDWLSGFGEGVAMLAAAGGPEVDPQADSDPEQKATWARNLARFDDDIARLEAFFLAVAAGELSEEERRQKGFTFINTDDAPQGAFYTVGWQMAATIEKALGREAVTRSVCDPRELLVAWNQVVATSAASEPPASWSRGLLDVLYGR